MALVVKDRVKETTTTTGTGTVTLAGAVSGFQAFSAVLSNADTTYYAIVEGSTGAWETGLGTFSTTGPTLARTTILESSNAGSAINLTAGEADVFITQPAEKAVYLDASGNITGAAGQIDISDFNNDAGYTTNTGTVTSVAASAGTGISISGSPITSSGTLTITNTAPDQTVTLTGSGATSISGTYPNFTISSTDTNTTYTAGTGLSLVGTTFNNTAPDQTVVLTSGTGISATGTYPNFTITNTAPDQTVVLTEGSNVTITGTYPNFTIASSDQFTGTVTSVGGTGTVNGLSLSGTVTSSGNLTLGGTLAISNADWSGTDLSVANGGTGASSFTANNVLLGNGTSAFQTVAPGTSGNVLTSNGTTWTSAAPAGGGAWELISTTNTGTGISVTITIPTGYKQLRFICEEIRFSSTSGFYLSILNNSNTDRDIWYVFRSIRASGSSETTYSSLSGDALLFESAASGTDTESGVYLDLGFQFVSGGKYVGYWQGGGKQSSGFYTYVQGGFGSKGQTDSTKIKFEVGSGNFLSGKIYTLGIA